MSQCPECRAMIGHHKDCSKYGKDDFSILTTFRYIHSIEETRKELPPGPVLILFKNGAFDFGVLCEDNWLVGDFEIPFDRITHWADLLEHPRI